MTPGEIELARRMFKNAVVYPKVRVFRRKWVVPQPGGSVVTPNGSIYFAPDYAGYKPDFSICDEAAEETFIHEMTHVYQHHQGVDVVARRLEEGGIYDYKIDEARDLNEYTIEQQAEMIADYSLCLRKYPAGASWCRDQYRPALNRFFENPGYLREAELRRLVRRSLPGGL